MEASKIEIDRLYRIDVAIETLHKILNELKDLRNEGRTDPFGDRELPDRRTPQSPLHPYPSERRTVIIYPGSAPQFIERRRTAGKGKLFRNRT